MAKRGHAIKAAFLGLTGLACSVGGQAFAADMPMPYYGDAPQEKVEFGTGWYIRGDAAYANASMPQISSDGSIGNSNARVSTASFGLGFGYKFNNWFRADLTGDYRVPNRMSGNGRSQTCITQVTTINNFPTTTATDSCTPRVSSSVRQWDLLQNVYLDLGTWYGFTPYIGAGAGLSFTRASTSVNWFMSNSLPYHVSTGGFYYNWDYSTTSITYQFAWAAMAGAAYQLTDNAYIDVGYRYINLGRYNAVLNNGVAVSKRDDAHEFRVGVRYMAD